MDVRYQLSSQEVDAIQSLVRTATKQFQSAEDGDFLFEAPLYSHELPRAIRAFLNDFRMGEWKKGYCLISGYPVDEAKIGPTPPHWQEKPGAPGAAETETLLLMLGALLGDAFSWSTQQAGRVVHQVMPIKAHEDEQLGTGSKELLW